jgi:uncharacterized SAM-binding protein YcdF (DUF218 family)
MLADWMTSHGLGSLKPVLSALALSPAPLLVLALAGAWRARTRPRAGGALVVLACVGLWLSGCNGVAAWIERRALDEPPALGAPERAALKAAADAGEPGAIVVLGSGIDRFAPEFGGAALNAVALSRLRYAVWLSRATGLPLAASGGRGWGAAQDDEPAEAEVTAATARADFGRPLRWIEADSRDTHENALRTVALLRAAGIRTIVVVTHGWHMPRAMREFRAAAQRPSPGSAVPRIVAAPMGLAYPDERGLLSWLPSGEGAMRMRWVLHEALGRIA